MTEIKNLGLIKAIHVGTTAPSNIKMLWYDTNVGIFKHKYYDIPTSTWLLLNNSNTVIYSGNYPTNIEVGGIPSGTNLTGLDFNAIIEQLTIEYLIPSFSSFSITGQSSLAEIGSSISGSKTFVWTYENGVSIVVNSISSTDVNTSTTIFSASPNDGSQLATLSLITFTSSPQIFRLSGQATDLSFFTRDFVINTTYPYFYGKVSSGGAAAGVNRPIANQALINSGIKVIASSTDDLIIDYSSTDDEYIWFAIPQVSGIKNNWYVNDFNTGDIGGSVSPSGNLFPVQDSISVTTVNWTGIAYNVYISNYQTAIANILRLRNN